MSCPKCGYCEHCGRGNGYYPYGGWYGGYPYTYTTGGNFQQTTTTTSDNKTASYEALRNLATACNHKEDK